MAHEFYLAVQNENWESAGFLKKNMPKKQYLGFTLIELLVVIAIIALLVSILLPSLNKAKELARKSVCFSNMKSLGTAAYLYQSEYDGIVPHGRNQHDNSFDPVTQPYANWKYLLAFYTGVEVQSGASFDNGQLEHGIYNCPSQKDGNCGNAAMGDKGFYGGYAWNNWSLGHEYEGGSHGRPVIQYSIESAPRPSRNIMISESGDIPVPSLAFISFMPYPYWYPAERHDGYGNVTWIDGSVSSEIRQDFVTHWYDKDDSWWEWN